MDEIEKVHNTPFVRRICRGCGKCIPKKRHSGFCRKCYPEHRKFAKAISDRRRMDRLKKLRSERLASRVPNRNYSVGNGFSSGPNW